MAQGDIVQVATASGDDSATLAFSSTPTDGNLIVLGVRASSGGGVVPSTPSGFTSDGTEGAARGGIGQFSKIASSESNSYQCDGTGASVYVVGIEIEGPFASPPTDVATTPQTSGNGQTSSIASASTGTLGAQPGIAVSFAGQALSTNTIDSWSNSFAQPTGAQINGGASTDGTLAGAVLAYAATTALSTTATFSGSARSKITLATYEYGAASSVTGSGASTLDDFSSSGAGTHTPPSFTGSGASTLADFVGAGSGTTGTPTSTGSGSSTLDDFSSSGAGTVSDPVFTGSGASTLADFTGAGTGTVSGPSFDGTGASTLADFLSAGAGTHTPPVFTGSGSSTLDDFTSAGSGTFAGANPGGLPDAAVIARYRSADLSLGALSSWADIGPGGEDPLVQATGANQPSVGTSYFGGAKSVVFDGTNDYLDMSLASSYSTDFAMIIVFELITYPTGSAVAIYSTGSIPNKNILGVDDAESPPGFVVMSGDGTQAEHHHGVADQTYLEDTPSRFVVTQRVRNDGIHKLWDRDELVIDLTDSGGGDPLNDMAGLILGAREDFSRCTNMAVAEVILVDVTQTDETTLLAARDELMTTYSVPQFVFSASGTGAQTLDDFTSSGAGTHTAPVFTGSGASTLADFISSGAGTHSGPGTFTGSGASQLADFVSGGAGTHTPPSFTGSGASTLENATSSGSGTFSAPGTFTGTGAITLEDFISVGIGTWVPEVEPYPLTSGTPGLASKRGTGYPVSSGDSDTPGVTTVGSAKPPRLGET